jgi:hypothetical protein
MWSTLAGGHRMKVVNLTGFTVQTSERPASFTLTRAFSLLLGHNFGAYFMMMTTALITISMQIFQCRSSTHFKYLYQLKIVDILQQKARLTKLVSSVK